MGRWGISDAEAGDTVRLHQALATTLLLRLRRDHLIKSWHRRQTADVRHRNHLRAVAGTEPSDRAGDGGQIRHDVEPPPQRGAATWCPADYGATGAPRKTYVTGRGRRPPHVVVYLC